MKNSFSTLGKIIKYEFKHSSRILLPLYGVLLVLGLLTGLSINGNKYAKMFSDSIETNSHGFYFNYSSDQGANSLVTGLLAMAVTVLTVAVIVVTIVTLVHRFKDSMLGNEAYLNLSLPATMSQQLGGRLIMYILWLLCAIVVIFLAFLLCFIRVDFSNFISQMKDVNPEIREFFENQNISYAKFILVHILLVISSAAWAVTLIFVVNAISHLLKNQKGFIKLLIVVALIFICGKVSNLFYSGYGWTPSYVNAAEAIKTYIHGSFLMSIGNLVWAAIYFGFSDYVFTKKLNLE